MAPIEMDRSGLTLRAAFPTIFSRSSPTVSADSPMILTASLLRFHPIEAAILLKEGDKRPRATKRRFIGGYSVLLSLIRRNPSEHYNLLFESCEAGALSLDIVRYDSPLTGLLTAFLKSRFGFTAMVDGDLEAFAGLSDILRLYQSGEVSSDLLTGSVSSPIVSVGARTSLKNALSLMFERRVRRLFINRTRSFVSDREIVSFLFSPRHLEDVRKDKLKMLDATLEDVGPIEAEEVTDDLPLREAAVMLRQSQGYCLRCTKGVVSPWDVVIKPFVLGKLVLATQGQRIRAG